MRWIAAVLVTFLAAGAVAATAPDVASFNRSIAAATRAMNDDASIALWDEQGVSLMPGREPIVGKPAIAAFVRGVTASMPPAKMETFDLECHDIAVSGDWASEWCSEHQLVRFSDGREPFEGWGKILYVLHRSGGEWKIRTEMWNPSPPAAEKK